MMKVFSDECVFDVDGKVKKHNVRIRGGENPHKRMEEAGNTQKITIWYAISINQVIVLFYSNDHIFNSDSYLSLLYKIFLPMLPSLPASTMFSRAKPHRTSK